MVWYGADDECYACGKIDCGPNCPRVQANNAADRPSGRGRDRREAKSKQDVHTKAANALMEAITFRQGTIQEWEIHDILCMYFGPQD